MGVDFTNMACVTFGLGIEGFRLSGSLLGRQEEIGTCGGHFWKTE